MMLSQDIGVRRIAELIRDQIVGGGAAADAPTPDAAMTERDYLRGRHAESMDERMIDEAIKAVDSASGDPVDAMSEKAAALSIAEKQVLLKQVLAARRAGLSRAPAQGRGRRRGRRTARRRPSSRSRPFPATARCSSTASWRSAWACITPSSSA